MGSLPKGNVNHVWAVLTWEQNKNIIIIYLAVLLPGSGYPEKRALVFNHFVQRCETSREHKELLLCRGGAYKGKEFEKHFSKNVEPNP